MKKFVFPVLIFAIAIYLSSCAGLGKKKDFNGNSIFYKKGVTEADVDKLGDYLLKTKFFNSEMAKSIQLLKEGDTFIVKVVVGEGSDKGDDIAVSMEALAIDISYGAFEQKPVVVHLSDGYFKTLRVIYPSVKSFGTRINFEEGILYYTENINKEVADKLVDYLKKIEFFKGNSKGVQIDKNENAYIFKMVMKPEKIEMASTEGFAHALANTLSKGVFDSAAVDIHFCNDLLQTQKEIPWQK